MARLSGFGVTLPSRARSFFERVGLQLVQSVVHGGASFNVGGLMWCKGVVRGKPPHHNKPLATQTRFHRGKLLVQKLIRDSLISGSWLTLSCSTIASCKRLHSNGSDSG